MIQFNPDGSIKLPEKFQQHKDNVEKRMQKGRCITIRKDLVSSYPPKTCSLQIKLSDAIYDSSFVEKVYKGFRERAEVPTKLKKISEKEFQVEVGTCFRRCSDCNALVARFRTSLDGNVIEDIGSCTYEKREFSYEDYFD